MIKNIFWLMLLVLGGFHFDAYSSICKQERPMVELLRCSTERDPKDLRSINILFETSERSGCCSHHGGVCGCSNGRAVCCDDEYSPTCGCD